MSRRRPIGQATPPQLPPNAAFGQPQYDYNEIIRAADMMKAATASIPLTVQQDISKGWHQLPNTPPQRSPKSWFFDPLSLQYSLGYKDRRYSVTYDTLKRISQTLSIISAIINTRSSQVARSRSPTAGRSRSVS
jgi:hypothetical protein